MMIFSTSSSETSSSIVDAIAKGVAAHDPVSTCGTDEVNLPVLRSLRRGTLDLSGFDYDALLA